jgi:hypothetical protein
VNEPDSEQQLHESMQEIRSVSKFWEGIAYYTDSLKSPSISRRSVGSLA